MKQLYQDRWFQIFLFVGSLIGGISAATIIYFSNLYWCFTAECFSNTLTIFKFPLAAFSSGLALAGFRAAMFRSEQAAKQMEELIRKNKFSDYLEHKKEFIRLVTEIEDEQEDEFYFANKDVLYSNLFPKNNPQYASFESEKLQELITEFNKCISNMNKIKTGDINALLSVFDKFMWIVHELRIVFRYTEALKDEYQSCTKHSGFIYTEEQYFRVFCVIAGLSNYCLPVNRVTIDLDSLLKKTQIFDDLRLVLSGNLIKE